MPIFTLLLIIAVWGGFLGLVARAIYWSFDHRSWHKNAMPCAEAGISDIDVKKIYLGKNNNKYKTVVSFYDGFAFSTARTQREQHLLSYTISVNQKEIAQYAETAHASAIAKLKKKGKRIYSLEELLAAASPITQKAILESVVLRQRPVAPTAPIEKKERSCPSCGQKQDSSRTSCWSCGQRF